MVWDRGKAAAASPASLAASAAAEGSRLDLVPSCRGPKAGIALLLRMCSALILSTSAAAATGAAASAAGGAADTGVFSAGDAGRTPAAVRVMCAELCLQHIYACKSTSTACIALHDPSKSELAFQDQCRDAPGSCTCLSPIVYAATCVLCLGIQ